MRKPSHHSVPVHSILFDRGEWYRCDNNSLFLSFQLNSSWKAVYKPGSLGRGSDGSSLRKVIGCRSYRKSNNRGQLSEEVKITSGVPQGSVLCTLLFLVYVNDIWRIIGMSIRLLSVDWINYRKFTNKNYIGKIQKTWINLGNGRWRMGWKKIPVKVRQYYLRTLGLKFQCVTILVTKTLGYNITN